MALVRTRCKTNNREIFQIIIYAADLSFLDKVVGSESLEDFVFIQAF